MGIANSSHDTDRCETLEEKISLKEAMKALQTLHKYYSQSAIDVAPSMMPILDKPMREAIKNDPFKE